MGVRMCDSCSQKWSNSRLRADLFPVIKHIPISSSGDRLALSKRWFPSISIHRISVWWVSIKRFWRPRSHPTIVEQRRQSDFLPHESVVFEKFVAESDRSTLVRSQQTSKKDVSDSNFKFWNSTFSFFFAKSGILKNGDSLWAEISGLQVPDGNKNLKKRFFGVLPVYLCI